MIQERTSEDVEFERIFWTLEAKVHNMTQGVIPSPFGPKTASDWVRDNCASLTVDVPQVGSVFKEMIIWCEQTLNNDFAWNFNTIYFKNPRDRTLFTLRFSDYV